MLAVAYGHCSQKCLLLGKEIRGTRRKIVKTEELIWGKDDNGNICLPKIQAGVVNKEVKVAITVLVPDLLLSFYIVATYLQGANLCNSIFRLVRDCRLCAVDMSTYRATQSVGTC